MTKDISLGGKKILVGVSGSIAAYKAADLVSRLVQARAEVTVMMTPAACQFVSPLTFQTLSGNPVTKDFFQDPPEKPLPTHTTLAGHADLVIIAPATADLIAKMALGLASDVVSAAVLASKGPVLIVPAMNVHMFENPITQKHLAELKARGVHQAGPEKGFLACRYEGMGRMAEPEAILAAAHAILFPSFVRRGRGR